MVINRIDDIVIHENVDDDCRVELPRGNRRETVDRSAAVDEGRCTDASYKRDDQLRQFEDATSSSNETRLWAVTAMWAQIGRLVWRWNDVQDGVAIKRRQIFNKIS